MDKELETYFSKLSITFKEYKHLPIFTVEEGRHLKKDISCTHTKSLFLKDNLGKFYLISMVGEKRLNIRLLENHLKVKKLRFASQEELNKELKITPGSVSLFCIIHSKSVHLILDKEIYESEEAGFHPNINTSTIVLKNKDLKKFYTSLENTKEVLELE